MQDKHSNNSFYRVSVKALIRRRGSVLVVRENDTSWDLPGGGLEHGEAPIDGLKRELCEELGSDVTPEVGPVIAVETFYIPSKEAWLIWIVYAVDISDESIQLGEGVSAARFVPVSLLAKSTAQFEGRIGQLAEETRQLGRLLHLHRKSGLRTRRVA